MFSCDGITSKKTTNSTDRYSEYNKKVAQEIESGKRIDDIFLGFKFGFTEKETNKHWKELLLEDKIYLDDKNRYCYDFIFSEYDWQIAVATFQTEYYEDKLYKLTLKVKYKNSLIDDYELNQSSLLQQLKLLYVRKYTSQNKIFPIEVINVLNKEEQYWIDGNKEIKISPTYYTEVNVTYTDLIPLQKIKLKEKEEKDIKKEKSKEKVKQTKSDI